MGSASEPMRSGGGAGGRAAARAARRGAERVRARRVHRREARAERRAVAAAALVDPVEHEHVVADAEHLGHAQRARSPSQRSPAASAAYSPGATPGARLDEPERLVLELRAVRLVDVAAADALERPHRAAGGRADRRLEAHRSESSRPRQAASTWSSTCSKPSGPP